MAAEVRNLAQRSATAAREIKALIHDAVQKVADGSELINQSGQTLEEIVTSVLQTLVGRFKLTAATVAVGVPVVAIAERREPTQVQPAIKRLPTTLRPTTTGYAREESALTRVPRNRYKGNDSDDGFEEF